MPLKHCPGCERNLPVSDFPTIRRRGRVESASRCRSCRNAQAKADYAKNRDARRAAQRERYAANPKRWSSYNKTYHAKNKDKIAAQRRGVQNVNTYKSWVRRLQQKGLTPEDYYAMLAAQGGVCAICRASHPGQKDNSSWAVDHDHATGKVRGLLCHACNLGLGMLKDSPEVLTKALAYLTASKVSK